MRDLHELLAEPAGAGDATPEEAAAALHELAVLLSVLTSRLNDVHAPALVDAPAGGDRLLTAAEAAERLGQLPRWLRGRRLPFAVRLSPRCLRYSESGLEKYMRRKIVLA